MRSSVAVDTIYSGRNQQVVYSLYNGRQVKTGDTILFTQNYNKKMIAVVASKNGMISYPKTIGNKRDVKANDMLYTISSIEPFHHKLSVPFSLIR